jgi:hypothetical protein
MNEGYTVRGTEPEKVRFHGEDDWIDLNTVSERFRSAEKLPTFLEITWKGGARSDGNIVQSWARRLDISAEEGSFSLTLKGPVIYWIPEGNYETLVRELTKIAKRAAKLGTGPISWREVGVEDRTVKRLAPWATRYVKIEVEGETPALAGWEFLATLKPLGGELLVNTVPGNEDLPERFRETEAFRCEHCGKLRRRSKVFVVRHQESGELKAVGSSCLRDFLGGKDPHAILSWLSLLDRALKAIRSGSEDDEASFGGGGDFRIETGFFLVIVAALIRQTGWVSRTSARDSDHGLENATADTAWRVATPPITEKAWQEWKKFEESITDRDREVAEKALAWAREVEKTSDYLHNLRLAAREETVSRDTIGLVASAIPAWLREEEQEVKRREKKKLGEKSEWIGKLKERHVFLATIIGERSWESDWGTTHFYRLLDTNGNILVWFGSKTIRADIGDTIEVRATIKKHDVYEGTHQTVLTRLTLLKKVLQKKSEEGDAA